MKKILIYLILLSNLLISEEKTFRVSFKDKGPIAWENNEQNPLFISAKKSLSDLALKRRQKTMDSPYVIFEDVPIYKAYLNAISNLGGKVLAQLKWNNYVVISIDSNKIKTLKSMDFVKSVELTSTKLLLQDLKLVNNSIFCDPFSYGNSFFQNSILNVIELHSMGITGSNVNLGMLDNGFQYNINLAMKNAKILKTWDFVFGDSIVYNDSFDVPGQDNHGSICLSSIAAFYQDSLIGLAPNANFYLGKTEDMRGEIRIEEDFYAAGVEWLESLGVDLMTASLGYYSYATSEEPYSFEEMDGKSSICSNAINNAVKRGMICFVPAGNSGPNPYTIITPGDAELGLTVGAVDKDGNIAGFSSRGNNSKNKIKPDFCSMGVNSTIALPYSQNNFGSASGTSLATPILAGASALILSLFPEIKPLDFKNILINSSSNKNNPDSAQGYGIPNIFDAIKSYDIAITDLNYITLNNYKRIIVNCFSNSEIENCKLFYYSNESLIWKSINLKPLYGTNRFIGEIPISEFSQNNIKYYIESNDKNGRNRRKPLDKKEYLEIKFDSDNILCGINKDLVNVEFSEIKNSCIYPNILYENQNINILLNSPINTRCEIKIFNILGKEIMSFDNKELKEGKNIISKTLNNISIGKYFIKIHYIDIIEFHSFLIVN